MEINIFYKEKFTNHDRVVELLKNNDFFNENFTNCLERFSLSKDQVIEIYGDFIKTIIGSLDELDVIEGPWLTVYSKGDFMESHNHRSFEYTLMHYISLKNDHKQTIIQDLNSELEYNPNCVEGDIIAIPGYLNHKVDIHNSDEQRIVGVINISSTSFIKPEENYEWSVNSDSKPVKNILEDYVFPGEENLIKVPVPDGMCKECY